MGNQPEYKYFKETHEEKQSNKVFYKFVIVLFVVYAFIFGIVYAYHCNFQYVTINGLSMQPTLNPEPTLIEDEEVQDGVYIKLTHDVDYDDIIVIDNVDNEDSIIKRALAFGGDYITIASIGDENNRNYRFMRVKKGSEEVEIINEKYIKSYDMWNSCQGVIVDGVEYESVLYTYYTAFNYNTKIFSIDLEGQQKEVKFFQVPEGDIFYMGDNRTGSKDARKTGTRPQEYVLGYVVKIVPNGTILKQEPISWFFQQIGDFFSIIWREILIFFGAKA